MQKLTFDKDFVIEEETSNIYKEILLNTKKEILINESCREELLK
jgi:hypothetical protein